ncbi:hypothetical protein [Pseudomonas sp.]|uniref:hypothetical protein n=1 Tax=Pseudomonas sp. TaxID=306 RepID=UPI003FD74285
MERSADALGRLLGDDTYNAVAAKANVEGGLGHKYYEEWRVLDPNSAEAKAIANQSKAYYDTIRGSSGN